MGIKWKTVEAVPERPKTRQIPDYYICDKCGRTADEPWPPWIPVIVQAGEHAEEGSQIATRLYCDDCSPVILEALVTLGFGTHYHGSTNFLEDPCVGANAYDDCPTRQKNRFGDDEDD